MEVKIDQKLAQNTRKITAKMSQKNDQKNKKNYTKIETKITKHNKKIISNQTKNHHKKLHSNNQKVSWHALKLSVISAQVSSKKAKSEAQNRPNLAQNAAVGPYLAQNSPKVSSRRHIFSEKTAQIGLKYL